MHIFQNRSNMHLRILCSAAFLLTLAPSLEVLAEQPAEAPNVSKTSPFPKQRIAAIAVGGLGVVVGIAAMATAGAAKSYEGDAWEACTGNREPNNSECVKGSSAWYKGSDVFGSRPQTLMNQAISTSHASAALGIVTGVALGTAAILWFTTSSPKNATAVQFVPYAAPGNAGAIVRFAF